METQWVKPQQSVFICTELRQGEEHCSVFFCQHIIKPDLFDKYLENKTLFKHVVCNRQCPQTATCSVWIRGAF